MEPLLLVKNLVRTYGRGRDAVRAVHQVSFTIQKGECLGLVGESGSGKSSLARLLLALEKPDHGEIRLLGASLVEAKKNTLRKMRQHIQVVFQDSNASLNDRLPVWRSVLEPLDNFPEVKPPFLVDVRENRRATSARLLEMVGLGPEHLDRYPHELSGGQRQRVAIARGISLKPELLICDEPTSSLDVTVQANILKLLKQLQTNLEMSFLFISHDIAAVHQMSNRILVMKDGAIVDEFASEQISEPERHDYTKCLLSAVYDLEQ
ncbi:MULTISPECIES: ABC transporter ATP-binding protein [Paenibacillus]|uniref:Peptide ABC transporter ATP-binding protein n=1 Tax=Paenibacillus amylolyticus TaxID=1451 RepID=A0A1R1C068_PAEAM|nr:MULTISPECIES: dipeptide/oligopeptide/nickel ABC transporter ATP-binding protein [Paenibacillus]MBD8836866.1 ABC transporter ATP-binding protein [Paenibacillus sp. CFBP 13594]MCF7753980.1 dipeptide/oligopeptide/nickel ABC transporter ATP-binding protein [Paenibacillus xylanexedens]OMF15513.1 peptide ABC transporter ATP-binding protein [Paenibacillus amylolyticus]PRA07872.1 ABC transporter ATP-binding protein [Paenibacillus sp. MYb63]PRA51516.1 ABC transporter ATP-binding protein [Paenibacill